MSLSGIRKGFLATVLAVFLLSKKHRKPLQIGMRFIACALTAMQLTGFVSTALTADTSGLVLEHNLSKEGEFELSSGTNVVEFVIDSADSSFFGTSWGGGRNGGVASHANGNR